MVKQIRSNQEAQEILSKWQTLFELNDYDIQVEFVSFEELNQPGMNQGLFISTTKGGWNSALRILLANSHEKYKNKQVDKQCDEMTIIYELLKVKKRLMNCPTHYLGALRGSKV